VDKESAPTPEDEPKKFLGIPYDLRPPTVSRAKSRLWNPNDRRLFTPKSLGWGYDLNFYWFVHPMRFLRRRSGDPQA